MNTEQRVTYNKMVAKAMSLPIEELKAQILKDSSDPVLPEVVFNSLIDALEKLVSEEEFNDFFCNQL